LICLHYESVQNQLDFQRAAVRALEGEIQEKEKQRGQLSDEARQKVPAHIDSRACLNMLRVGV